MLQSLFKKKTSNPSPDTADSPVESTPSVVVSRCEERPVSPCGTAAWRFAGLTEFIARTEQKCLDIPVPNAGNSPRLGQVRRELRCRMTSRPEGIPQHITRTLESAYRESWRKWREFTGVV